MAEALRMRSSLSIKVLLDIGHECFPSLTKKWYDKYIADQIEPLEFAEKSVNSKPSLAIEILLNSTLDTDGNAYTNWQTPSYIEEGLKVAPRRFRVSDFSAEIQRILELTEQSKCFVLSGGVGSGKTYTLVEAIRALTQREPSRRLACITYTNAAADEIRERVARQNLWVSIIHDFVWENIKRYQKELQHVFRELIESDEPEHKSFARPNDESVETGPYPDLAEGIQYREFVRIRDGIISHDEVLVLASEMFEQYPKLCRIVADRHPCIFVDEYPDTSPLVVTMLLDCIKATASDCVVGFFGDAMQAIYDGTVGSLRDRIETRDSLMRSRRSRTAGIHGWSLSWPISYATG